MAMKMRAFMLLGMLSAAGAAAQVPTENPPGAGALPPADSNAPAFRYEGFKRIECDSLSNVMLRAAHYFGTNEVLYRVSFADAPTPYFFVRLGDFIGEYEIVGAGGRRGDEHLVLRKAGEEVILPRARKYYASPLTVRREKKRE